MTPSPPHPHQTPNWDHAPFIVIWEVTRACSLACRHCRAEAIPHRHPLELQGADALSLIDQVARANPKIFILTGGDPMARPDLPELCQYATSLGLHVALSPSATPRWLRANLHQLRNSGVQRISLSLDGATQSSHDAFRGIPGTWQRTWQSIHAAHDAGLSIQINTTITRQNLPEIDLFPDLLLQIQPATWSVFLLVPTGRAHSNDLISPQETEDLFHKLATLSTQLPFGIKTTEGHHYRRILLQRRLAKPNTPGMQGLADGRGFVFISHTGEIYPSGFLPISAGNVRSHELIDVYRHSTLFRQLRSPNLLKGKCGRCPYRQICGGSRARAYALTGDYLQSDPLCIFQPEHSHSTAQPTPLPA